MRTRLGRVIFRGLSRRLISGGKVSVLKADDKEGVKIRFRHKIKPNELSRGKLRRLKHGTIRRRGRLITELNLSLPAALALVSLLAKVLPRSWDELGKK